MNQLVSTEWLGKNLEKVKILDASWHLPNANRNSYDEYKVETDYETALKEWEETPEEDREDWYTKPELEFYQSFLGKIGQYKLYPTENMYNFLMVNTETGLTYRVQWNIDKDLRFIQLIW